MTEHKDIFLKNNPYGYQININHPRIAQLYARYKRWKNIPQNCPMSDDERHEFEQYILRRKKIE